MSSGPGGCAALGARTVPPGAPAGVSLQGSLLLRPPQAAPQQNRAHPLTSPELGKLCLGSRRTQETAAGSPGCAHLAVLSPLQSPLRPVHLVHVGEIHPAQGEGPGRGGQASACPGVAGAPRGMRARGVPTYPGRSPGSSPGALGRQAGGGCALGILSMARRAGATARCGLSAPSGASGRERPGAGLEGALRRVSAAPLSVGGVHGPGLRLAAQPRSVCSPCRPRRVNEERGGVGGRGAE